MVPILLIDSHCHLDRLKLERYPNGLKDAINAATEAGVSHMLCVCISKENKDAVVAIAEEYPHIFASVGIHPCDVSDSVTEQQALTQWSQHAKVVAIGETGLDYFHSTDHVDAQLQSFQNHLLVAGEQKLPVIVHTRSAQDDTIECIKNYGNQESSGVLHCFTETWDMAKQALDMNYYISLSGIVTFKNAIELKDVAKKVPLDRLLVETDSPYLAPVPYRGKPNEPRYVREVAEYVAQLRGITFEELAEATSENFFRLFNKAKA